MDTTDRIGFIKRFRLPESSPPFKIRPISTDLEDFRKYLKIHGVMEYFTKYLSKLKKERPEDPIKMLQDNKDKDMEIEELKKQLAEANAKIEELKIKNKKLKKVTFQE